MTDESSREVLNVTDLRVAYNRHAMALHGISISVGSGEIVGVLGANGAGKTTMLRAIGGFLRSEPAAVLGGSIELDGVSLVGRPPHWIARRGVAIVPERDKVFPSLTVQENLASVPRLQRHHRQAMMELVLDLFQPLQERMKQPAGLLSGGERQMLAVARALLLEPKVLLADELSFGIAPIMLGRLMEALKRINMERGVSILLVEQNAAAVFDVADRIYLLEHGLVSTQGSSAELRGSHAVQWAYLGGHSGERSSEHGPGDPSGEKASNWATAARGSSGRDGAEWS